PLQRSIASGLWFAALMVLSTGLLFAGLAVVIGTSATGAVAGYQVLAIAALLVLLSAGSAPHCTKSPSRARVAFLAIFLLSCWSWGSALRMALQSGRTDMHGKGCILLARGPFDYQPPNSIAEMRLPRFYADWTGPTGSTLLEYHAVLVVPNGSHTVYNWSKIKIRFEPLDPQRNPYLPRSCPDPAAPAT
ncbi:hypothetical protein, partial [Pseudophaeobacter sp.]|uniref:hypothetical protein n=1 Tax=Pseudophaeobacter sp. TaxID=1971739 RepID=UPI003298FCB2